jgi:hypothetical protein
MADNLADSEVKKDINIQEVVAKIPTSKFLSSRPEEGQRFCLTSYGVPQEVTNGLYCIFKVIGTYATEADAEKRAKIELDRPQCRVIKISPTGEWISVVDPLMIQSFKYDKYHDGQIKNVIASMNNRIDNKEKEDEKELQEAMTKLKMEESNNVKDTLHDYMILVRRLNDLPHNINYQRGVVNEAVKEIRKLEDLEPKLKALIASMEQLHPDYKDKLEAYIENLKKT